MSLYTTYYLSESSSVIKPCNQASINFYPTTCGNVYSVVLCYNNTTLLGTGTLVVGNVPIVTIQFQGVTNATVQLSSDYVSGSIKITQPVWKDPKAITLLFMNSRLTYN
jgi:hypothetical protein